MTSGFLYGELAPTRSRHILNGIVRPLARLAAGLTLTLLLLALAQWMWLALKTDGYRNEIAGLFRESFPKAAMVDPLLQMRRQVAQARRAAGQLAGGDFLYLIEPLTELPSGGVRAEEVSFENGRLRVKANFSNEAMERLKALGPQHGISLVIDSIQVSGDRQVASISLVEGAAR
jgi:type II secretory pathway component PulL